MDDVDPLELFRQTMGRFPATVSIITTWDGERVAGMTATAVTSYSGNPPSMLCCVGHSAQSHDLLQACHRFAINVLHDDQVAIALAFTRSDPAKFSRDEYAVDEDFALPVISGTLATLVCERSATFSHFDHSVMIGTVVGGRLDVNRRPLVYSERGFWALVARDQRPESHEWVSRSS